MKSAIILVFIVFSNFIFAQNLNFTLQRSKEFEVDYKDSEVVLIKEFSKNDLVVVRSYLGRSFSNLNGFYIEHFDANLKSKSNFEFRFNRTKDQKNGTIIGVTTIEQNIVVIEIFYDSKQKQSICQANIIGQDYKITTKELFRLSNEEVSKYGNLALDHNAYIQSRSVWENQTTNEIYSEYENGQYVNFNEYPSNFFLRTNTNGLSIIIDFYNDDSKNLKIYSFDNELNKKIETNFKKEVKDKDYIYQTIQLDPNSDIFYLLAKSYSDELKKKKEGGRYDFELTKISENNQKSTLIQTNENHINRLKLVFNNDKIIGVGFYSKENENRFGGICYYSFNSNQLESINSKISPFTEQFLMDKYGKVKNKELKDLTFKNVYFSNNDLFFDAEEQYIRLSGSSFNGVSVGVTRETFLIYNDIVCSRLNQNGDLVWVRNINKSQGTKDDESFISYTSVNKDGLSYFFINTGEKINKISNGRIEFTQTRKNKSNLNVIWVNSDGNFEYKELLDDENSAVPFMISKGTLINNAVIFHGKKGKSNQLLKISL